MRIRMLAFSSSRQTFCEKSAWFAASVSLWNICSLLQGEIYGAKLISNWEVLWNSREKCWSFLWIHSSISWNQYFCISSDFDNKKRSVSFKNTVSSHEYTEKGVSNKSKSKPGKGYSGSVTPDFKFCKTLLGFSCTYTVHPSHTFDVNRVNKKYSTDWICTFASSACLVIHLFPFGHYQCLKAIFSAVWFFFLSLSWDSTFLSKIH